MGNCCDRLVVATTNRHKFQEFCELLRDWRVPLHALDEFAAWEPVREDGSTLAENACRKAAGYAGQLQRWVLADDTGLEVDALGGAPGIHTARFAGEKATMAQNRAQLLASLRQVPRSQRSASFVCHLAVADPTGAVVTRAVGRCQGWVREQASAGSRGFGYDVLFEVADRGLTLAELSPEETAQVGHRGRAVRELMRQWRPG